MHSIRRLHFLKYMGSTFSTPPNDNNIIPEQSGDVRNGSYTFGKLLVVREGEQASIFENNGTHKVIEGPASLRPYFSEVKFLERRACDEQSYLAIEYLDGRKEHKRG